MPVRALIAAIAIVAIPIAVNGAEPAAKSRDDSARRYCQIHTTIGTRLGNTRVCRTKAERDENKAEGRDVVQRIQNMRATVCGLAGTPSC